MGAGQVNQLSDNASIPPLVFSVGVTGHRDIAAARRADLRKQITELLEQVRGQLLAGMANSALDAARAVTCRFVSALAPGADQIGALAALETAEATPKWHLNLVLPFPQAVYAATSGEALREGAVEQADIDAALAAISDLTEKAHHVLELADWQPSEETLLTRDWQARRYATIGQMLVRQADLLIALWDGNPARGRGGTADVVSEARRSGVPVIWIDLTDGGGVHSLVPDPGSNHLPAADLVSNWRKTTEASDPHARLDRRVVARADAAITAAIAQVLLGNNPARAICVRRYLDEAPAQLWIEKAGSAEAQPGDSYVAYASMLYRLLKWPTTVKRTLSRQEIADKVKPGELRSNPFRKARLGGEGRWRKVLLYPFSCGIARDEHGTANAAPLMEYAARADALATRLSNQYRSAYVKIFALAPIAVTWAVLSVMMPTEWLSLLKEWLSVIAPKEWLSAIMPKEWKPIFVSLELLTVGWAAGIYMRTRAHDPVIGQAANKRWWRKLLPPQDTHQRWLDARFIAESQRSGQLLAWVGFSGRRPLEDPVAHHPHGSDADDHTHDSGHATARTLWAPHYANAIAALPELPLDETSPGQRSAITPPRVVQLARTAGKVIADQLRYHDLNYQRLQALNHRLDGFSLLAIIVAFVISLLYLILWVMKLEVPEAAPWPALLDHHSSLYYVHAVLYVAFKYAAAFCGAVLPAVAAAAAGIRFQGDFERFAMRSKETATRLDALAERASNLAARAGACGEASCIDDAPLFESLVGLLLETQSVLDEDLADWRFAYAARPITLG
ncbi:hypothetical protein DBR17_15805 [Sphingomonas sp. HMWF008]|nr:hypothetical protein DBR17_15805 [Sphingomonas sp. HMWF008]